MSADLVPATAAEQINAELAAMTAAGQKTLDHAQAVGQMLARVKTRLPHGQFLPWVEANIDCSARHAQRLMALAKSDSRVAFDPDASIRGALKQIAAPPKPKTPKVDYDPEAVRKTAKTSGVVEDQVRQALGAHGVKPDAAAVVPKPSEVCLPPPATDRRAPWGMPEPTQVDLEEAVAATGEDPAATIRRLKREVERLQGEVEDLKRQLVANNTWHTPPDMPVVTVTGNRLGWRGNFDGWKVTDHLETHEVYAQCIGQTPDGRPVFHMVSGGWLTPLDQPSAAAAEHQATAASLSDDLGDGQADDGAGEVAGLEAVFWGPNRDRIQVYSKTPVSGVPVRWHGDHDHKGQPGRICELGGGKCAWIAREARL